MTTKLFFIEILWVLALLLRGVENQFINNFIEFLAYVVCPFVMILMLSIHEKDKTENKK